MWKANGRTTTLALFLDSLFPNVWKMLWTCRKTDYYLKKVSRVELRHASLPGYELGSRGIELNWQLQNNGK
jgi:hypothetical protein